MLPLLGAIAAPLISGAASLFGQQSANKANAKQAADAMRFSAAEAEKNRKFQAEQSASSWQRGVKDMAAAGLNPALAYEKGGASSPSGSAASGVQAHMGSSGGAAVSGAERAASLVNEVKNGIQMRAKVAADTAESLSRADLTRTQADQIRKMLELSMEETRARTSSAYSVAGRQRAEEGFLNASFQQRIALMEAQWAATNASAEATRQLAPMRGVQTDLLRASLPAARNLEEAAKTFWGKRISPYLGDAKSLTGAFNPWLRR
ncbi:MAG: DNA pilot protein [Arizlama microvirus]|nr:MAG: DNA pilot protein [Arizlama microvirus]